MDPITNIMIFAVTEVLKRTAKMPPSFAPFVAVVCGVALAVSSAMLSGLPPDAGVVDGVVKGLTTAGAYSLVKNIIGGIRAAGEVPTEPPAA